MDELLTVEVVARRLGITRMGVYGMVFKHRIPVIKISKRCVRFAEKDIDLWLAGKKQGVGVIVPYNKCRGAAGRKKTSAIDSIIAAAKKEVLV